ncbi:MAG: sel1 repeat family protein, partial [Porticoccaceae bacterium]|nr:sel1 repeat family protein [Porticoccaceae bacterium]
MKKLLQNSVLCCCLLSTIVLANDFDAGMQAVQRGHYETALRTLLPLAESGMAKAQNNLGHLHEKGLGVSQSYTEALAWYVKAGTQGLAKAQHNVGMLYFNGTGVVKDHAEAYA